MCLVGNNQVWTASDDKSIRVTNAKNYKFVKKLKGHMDYINSLAVVGGNRQHSYLVLLNVKGVVRQRRQVSWGVGYQDL